MDELKKQIAEKFALAFLSVQLGISDREAKKYLSDQTVGELWLTLADIAIETTSKNPVKLK